MPISHWPRGERPRDKLVTRGASNLSDAKLLAILLRTGTRGKTVIGLARGLLAQFAGLRALLKSSAAAISLAHDPPSEVAVRVQSNTDPASLRCPGL